MDSKKQSILNKNNNFLIRRNTTSIIKLFTFIITIVLKVILNQSKKISLKKQPEMVVYLHPILLQVVKITHKDFLVNRINIKEGEIK